LLKKVRKRTHVPGCDLRNLLIFYCRKFYIWRL
jgi:hypothetical protein